VKGGIDKQSNVAAGLEAEPDMPRAPARRLFTVEDYHRMGDAGIFSDGERVELIDGVIVAMTPIGSPHAGRVKRLNALLTARLGRRAIVQVQDPLLLTPLSEPQPDLAVLKPRADFYVSRHPEAADVLLVIEVADRSRASDRNVKVPLYARAGIAEVWVIDIIESVIDVYRRPLAGTYRNISRLRSGQRVAIARLPRSTLRVSDILA
jgi:Uma2 family endonuclease